MKNLTLTMTLLASCSAVFALSPDEQVKVKETAQAYIKANLKAPATAIFSGEMICARQLQADNAYASGKGPLPECMEPQTIGATNGDAVVYRADVDAQNSFGALVRTQFYVAVLTDAKTGKLSVIDPIHTDRILYDACVELNKDAVALGKRSTRNCDAEYPRFAKER